MVAVSLVTYLIVLGAFGSIGLGTGVSALIVGMEMRFFIKIFGAKVKAAMGA